MKTVGKCLMTLAIGIYTFIPPVADLATDTHVFHSDWTPHARLHTVWLLGVSSSLGLLALYLLWLRKEQPIFNTHLAAMISSCVYGSFFLSALTAQLYGGGLTDAVGGAQENLLGLDVNLAVFCLASMMLAAGWRLCTRFQR